MRINSRITSSSSITRIFLGIVLSRKFKFQNRRAACVLILNCYWCDDSVKDCRGLELSCDQWKTETRRRELKHQLPPHARAAVMTQSILVSALTVSVSVDERF